MADLKVGSKGSAVVALQKALNKEGVKPKLKPDGAYGKNTAKAVEAFQRKAGLKQTGAADKATLSALSLKGGGGGSSATPTWKLGDPATLDRHVRDEIINVRAYDRLDGEISADPSHEARGLLRELRHHRAAYDRAAENLLYIAGFLIKARKEFEKVVKKDPKAAEKILEKAERAFAESEYQMARWGKAITNMQAVNKRFLSMAA
ncbi:MAG: peptidoglycan-binding domain-containing protein [Pseudomonadota bacterium]